MQSIAQDDADFVGLSQTIGRAAAVGTYQTACTQLGAPKPAHHQHYDVIAILPLNGLQYWPAGGAAGLSIIKKTIRIIDLPGPAVVAGLGHLMRFNELQCLFAVLNRGRNGQKPAAFDFFFPAGDSRKRIPCHSLNAFSVR